MIRSYSLAVVVLGFSVGILQAGAQAAITAEPDQVRFAKMEDSVVIHVKKGDDALPSKAVKSARVVIGKSDYSHQFIITTSASGPATITLSPKPDTAQSGTFTLAISTKYGDALVAIDMPLDQIPGTLDDRAKKEGITVDELKAKLGLSQEGKRETIAVGVSQWQYVGSMYTLRMPEVPDRYFTWKIDGNVVLEGKGENTLKYVLDKSGKRGVEMEAREGDAIVAQWSGVLTVVDFPDMRWQVHKRSSFQLRGPRGYRSHHWKIDGRNAGNDEFLKHTFKEAGEHTIECTSRDPVLGDPGEFRALTWKTMVK